VLKALTSYQARLEQQREENGWMINTNTCSGGSGGIYTNDWVTASTGCMTSQAINFVINTLSSSGATGYTTGIKDRRPKHFEPALKNHRGILIRSSDKAHLFSDISQQEILALQLLRKMVDGDSFRKYLRHGFVPVRGASGLIYQVDRINRIKVWERGELLAHLCVHLKGNVPPTDEVVGKILIIEYNEADIWKRSNISWMVSNRDRRSLELVGQASKTPENQNIVIANGGNYTVQGVPILDELLAAIG